MLTGRKMSAEEAQALLAASLAPAPEEHRAGRRKVLMATTVSFVLIAVAYAFVASRTMSFAGMKLEVESLRRGASAKMQESAESLEDVQATWGDFQSTLQQEAQQQLEYKE